MSYPRLVYRCPGSLQRAGGTYDHKAVEDDAELNAALSDGWYATLPEAIEGISDKGKDDDAPPTRAELEAKAKELGIKFDGRLGDAKLGKLIDDALDN